VIKTFPICLIALVVAICVLPVSGAETFNLAFFYFTDTHREHRSSRSGLPIVLSQPNPCTFL